MITFYGDIAQMAERPAVNRIVAGSIPAVPVFDGASVGGSQLSHTQSIHNSKNCFRYPAAPIMLLWRNGSAADL